MNRLRIRNLHLGYGSQTVLRDLRVELDAGQWTHVHGENGAGKTSFLKLLAAFHRPREGELTWNEESVWPGPASHRRRVRYLGHQSCLQGSLTVRDNWELFAGLFGFEDPLPREFLSGIPAGRRVNRLSRGQKHRLELATVLVSDRPLLLLDEPFVSLDAPAVRRLEDQLANRVSGGSMVVSVSPEPISGADRNRRLRDGRLGDPE